MTDKDPKDMTVSELLREADSNPCSMCHLVMTGDESCATIGCASWAYRLADKIDAELAQARELSLRQGADLWAKANGWPDFCDGEDFGAWLERCALKLPCDKDGEPWSIGDRVMPGNRSESTVTGYSFDGADWFLKYRWCGIDSYANEFATSCKRAAPEVLGADGKPIVVGETVWNRFGTKNTVERLEYSKSGLVKVWYKNGHFDISCTITHTPPDTQERIDEDALKSCVQYWGCNDFNCGKCPALIDGKKPVEFYELDPIHDSCHEAQRLDLLRRQRELDKRTGGTE